MFGLPSDLKEGVIFSTYATLVSSVQQGEIELLIGADQILPFSTVIPLSVV